MLTPFKDNGEVDYAGLTKLINLYLESGVSGLFANCLSSEMYELSPSEQLRVVRHVIKAVNGVIPVVATGTFEGSLIKQAAFVKKMHDTGVDAVIVITGIMASVTEPDKLLTERILQLLQLTGNIKLGLYECPVPYKRVITAEQLKTFVSTNRITYLKDTSLDIEQVKAKLEAVKGHAGFGLYDAYMAHAVDSLKAGSAGLSCIQGNFFPELIVWLCENYNNAGLKDDVDRVQQVLRHNMDLVHHVYPVIAKYFLQKRGLKISTCTRRQVGVFNLDVRRKIDKFYTQLGHLQKALNIPLAGYPV